MRDAALSALPVLRRELLTLLRSRKAFWITAATVAATGLIPLLAWPESGSAAPSQVARDAFEAYCSTFLVALFLFVPGVAASSYTSERERGTYELLLATRLSPAGIFLGKLLSSIGLFLLLLAATLPMAAMLELLGGFEVSEFGRAFISMCTFTLITGAMGVVISIKSERTMAAVLVAYGATILLVLLVSLNEDSVPMLFRAWLLAALAGLSLGALRRSRSRARPRRSWQVDHGENQLGRVGPSKAWGYLNRRLLRFLEARLPERLNPVFTASVRSLAPWPAGSARAPDLIAGAGFLVPILLGTLLDPLTTAMVGAVVSASGLALVLPGLAALILIGEREPGKLDALRGTLLRAPQIISGKLQAVLLQGAGVLLPGILCCLVCGPFLLSSGRTPWGWTLPLLFLAASGAIALVSSGAGLLAAALSRAPLQALILAFLISVGYLLGPALFLGFHDRLSVALSPLSGFISMAWKIRQGIREIPFQLFYLSLGISVGLAVLQLALATALFARNWVRDR